MHGLVAEKPVVAHEAFAAGRALEEFLRGVRPLMNDETSSL